MNLLGGLYLHEVILMVLGTMLFLVLLFLLIYSFIKNRSLKSVLPLFLLPVLMIGFSAIKKIQYDKWVIELKNDVDKLEGNPGDQRLKAEVESKIALVTARPIDKSVDALVTVARAQTALGKDDQALTTVDKALQIAPQSTEAANIRAAIVDQQNLKRDAAELEKKTEQLERNPNDPNLKREVNDKINKVANRPTTNPEVLIRLARAQKAVGQEEQAINTAKQAVKIDPSAATKIAPILKIDANKLSRAQPTATSPTVQPKQP
jgi:tetratricopeptide (TPR) repeat protein